MPILQTLGLAFLLASAILPPAQAQSRVVCEGEFGTGSGMAGSYVGRDCFLSADSPEERLVQTYCRQNSTCRIEADVRTQDGRRIVTKLHRIDQTKPPQTSEATYVAKLGRHLDGILAPSDKGCSAPDTGPDDRVSVLFAGAHWPAVQINGEFCVATTGSGDDPTSDRPFRARVALKCGPLDAKAPSWPRAAVETPRDVTFEVRSGQPGAAGAVVMDGLSLMRCPITRTGTPRWWIDKNPTFKGRYPEER